MSSIKHNFNKMKNFLLITFISIVLNSFSQEINYEMNNYSWLQQRLHQLALSSNFMREMAFDIESTFISPPEEGDMHVFVAGLARSGTTILLNAIHESHKFASLSYNDMPFVLAPNLWSKISFDKKNIGLIERSHGDGIKISTESPEAFEEVFWKTFDDGDPESAKKFKIFVKKISICNPTAKI